VPSVARPGKLFTAHAGLMIRSVGVLTPAALARVLSAVVAILQPAASPYWPSRNYLFRRFFRRRGCRKRSSSLFRRGSMSRDIR
jgi:hypothetical protein